MHLKFIVLLAIACFAFDFFLFPVFVFKAMNTSFDAGFVVCNVSVNFVWLENGRILPDFANSNPSSVWNQCIQHSLVFFAVCQELMVLL